MRARGRAWPCSPHGFVVGEKISPRTRLGGSVERVALFVEARKGEAFAARWVCRMRLRWCRFFSARHLTRNAEVFHAQKYDVASRQGDVRGNARAFLSERLLGYLNDDFLAGLQQLRNGGHDPFGSFRGVLLDGLARRFRSCLRFERGRRRTTCDGCPGNCAAARLALSETIATAAPPHTSRNAVHGTIVGVAHHGGLHGWRTFFQGSVFGRGRMHGGRIAIHVGGDNIAAGGILSASSISGARSSTDGSVSSASSASASASTAAEAVGPENSSSPR